MGFCVLELPAGPRNQIKKARQQKCGGLYGIPKTKTTKNAAVRLSAASEPGKPGAWRGQFAATALAAGILPCSEAET
jgi:hypothetical protein